MQVTGVAEVVDYLQGLFHLTFVMEIHLDVDAVAPDVIQ